MSLLQLHPLLIAAVAALLYPLALLVRRWGPSALFACWAAALVIFIALPGGRAVFDATGELPDRLDRGRCLVGAISHGAPLKRLSVSRSHSCADRGRGFRSSTDEQLAAELIAGRAPLGG